MEPFAVKRRAAAADAQRRTVRRQLAASQMTRGRRQGKDVTHQYMVGSEVQAKLVSCDCRLSGVCGTALQRVDTSSRYATVTRVGQV